MEINLNKVKYFVTLVFIAFVLIITNKTFVNLRASVSYNALGVLGQVNFSPIVTELFNTNYNDNNSIAHNSCSGLISEYKYIANNVGFSDGTFEHIAYDSVNNRIFVSDEINHRVLVFDSDSTTGLPDDVFADNVLGKEDFNDCAYTASASASNMYSPGALAYDSTNNLLYVADVGNYRVLVFDVGTITNGEPAVNVLGQANLTSNTISGYTQSTFNLIRDLLIDETTNRLFVAVSDVALSNFFGTGRVLVFDVSTITNGEPAVNIIGQLDYTSGDDIASDTVLTSAQGLGLDISRQVLYVSDPSSSRVILFNVDENSITNGDSAILVLGQTDFTSTSSGTTQSSFYNPTGLSYNNDNDELFVADTSNNRLLVFDMSLDYGLMTNGFDANRVLGQPDFTTGTLQSISNSTFSSPMSIYVDQSKDIIAIFDNGNNRALFSHGVLSPGTFSAVNVLGQADIDYNFSNIANFLTNGINNSTHNRIYNSFGFNEPQGLAIDESRSNLFVADRKNNRIVSFDLDSNSEPTNYEVEYTPFGLDYVFDTVYPEPPSYPTGAPDLRSLAYDSKNQRLFFSKNFSGEDAWPSVSVFDASTLSDSIGEIASIGYQGILTGTPSQENLGRTYGIAYDGDNERIFVADTDNSRVMVFDSDPSEFSLNDSALYVLGKFDFDSQIATSITTGMSGPKGVAYDSERKYLFVADTGNARVLVYDVDPANIVNGLQPFAVIGQSDFTTQTQAVSQSGFSSPNQLTYDQSSKTLFVTDTNANRILFFDVGTISNGMEASAVIGQSDFVSSSAGLNQSSFNTPFATAFAGGTRTLYVSDSGNNRVLFYKFVSIPAQSFSSVDVGSAYTQSISTDNSQGSVTYELVSGSLPAGITLGSTGLSGTPTANGTYDFTLRAIDTVGVSAFYSNQRQFSITVTGGGTTGGEIFCQDSSANNFGAPGNCTYTQNNTCTDPLALNVGEVGVCVFDQEEELLCQDSTASNYQFALPCTYPPAETCATNPALCPPVIQTCNDPMASNNGSQGTCIYPPASRCLDITANNYNQVGACTYPQSQTCATNPALCPPVVTICQDSQANNNGEPGTCTYDPVETCATNPALCPPVIDDVTPPESSNFSWPDFSKILGTQKTKIFTSLALLAGLLGTLFANPFALSELILLPTRLWSLFLAFFGIKKRARPWGTVYDSVTKQPLDPAYVSLLNTSGEEVSTSITDLDGRYGFLVPPGVYQLLAKKTNYIFPSKNLAGRISDELYKDLYFGGNVVVENEGQVIARNIPMDPTTFDWNEESKKDQKLMRFYSKYDKIILALTDIFFVVGFVIAILALVFAPAPYNIIIFALYVLLLIVRKMGISPKKLSSVIDEKHNPISFAIVRIYRASQKVEVAHKVTNSRGQFYCLIPNGNYYLTIERKNPDQTYTKVHESLPFEVKRGVVREKIVI